MSLNDYNSDHGGREKVPSNPIILGACLISMLPALGLSAMKNLDALEGGVADQVANVIEFVQHSND